MARRRAQIKFGAGVSPLAPKLSVPVGIPGGSPGAVPTYESPGLPGAPPPAPVAPPPATGGAKKTGWDALSPEEQARRIKAAQAKRKFTPWDPNMPPPPGTYDPAFDAQLGAAKRGLAYQFGSSAANDPADTGDYDVAEQRAQSDLATGFENIGITRSRANQDLDAQIASLQRRYGIQAFNQGQQARRAGVRSGGALVAAMHRRAANEAFDRRPIDVNRQRLVEDYGDAGVDGSYGRQGLQLQQGYERGAADRNRASQRGFEEYTALEGDVLAGKLAQAGQAGYVPPAKPKGEFTHSKTGQKYKLIKEHGRWKKILPSGRKVPRSDITTME